MTGPGLVPYLVVSSILFGIGVAAVLSQRNAIMILMGVEIMINAAILNLVAFWRFVRPDEFDAQVFVVIAITIAAIEMAVGLALMLLIFRQRRNTNVDSLADLQR